MAASPLRMLIVSLGNPPPLHETYHSAGHIVLQSLQRLLPAQQPFARDRYGKKACSVSYGPKYTLIKSPTLMNVVGPWLLSAWKHASKGTPAGALALVVVQDELELDLGAVLTKDWGASHKGHNGIRSAQASLLASQYPGALFSRVRVGIGRPTGRDRSTVSDYVLGPVGASHMLALRDQAAPAVLQRLEELEEKWIRKAAGQP